MNDNRNVIWIAVAGVLAVLIVSYMMAKPASPPVPAASAPAPAAAPVEAVPAQQ